MNARIASAILQKLTTKPPPKVEREKPVMPESTFVSIAHYAHQHYISREEHILIGTLIFPLSQGIAEDFSSRKLRAQLGKLHQIEASAVFNAGYLAGVKAKEEAHAANLIHSGEMSAPREGTSDVE